MVPLSDEEPINYPELARDAVGQAYEGGPMLKRSQIYVVWFCYILGGWKALLSTTLPDDKYYEVTYNKDKDEVYVDTYVKQSNKQFDMEYKVKDDNA